MGEEAMLNGDSPVELLADISYKARLERAIVFTVEVWDVNYRKHIQQPFTLDDMKEVIQPLETRVKELEMINSELLKQFSCYVL